MPYTVYSQDGRKFTVPTRMIDDVLDRGYSMTKPGLEPEFSYDEPEPNHEQLQLFDSSEYDEEG